MVVEKWLTPINAECMRSNELKDISFSQNVLRIFLTEESGVEWEVVVKESQAFKVTSEECPSDVTLLDPKLGGGFFKTSDSNWFKAFKKNCLFIEHSLHFFICCYDVNIEIIADETSIEFKRL
jgi:hypothetical protein